ncbi:MAG: cobyrinate a,c-diamide synthase [Candidatus Hydrogenedentales bacterium]
MTIAAPGTGAGKTTVTLGLMAALRGRGLRVQPFKVGPDYLDPAYHWRVCGRASINLDPWLTSEAFVRETFAYHMRDTDVAVIEGVMGLFDGVGGDAAGYGSTAHVAALVRAPVVLVVDASGSAETAAAVAMGCARYAETMRDAALTPPPGAGVGVVGVIFNNVGGDAHAATLRRAITPTDLPVFGCLPRDGAIALPERHLGLVSVYEHPLTDSQIARMRAWIEAHVDVEALLRAISEDGAYSRNADVREHVPPGGNRRLRIGVARDAAFCFYYEDNLRLLGEAGAEFVPFSPLSDAALPSHLDALYLGGGFPESFADGLAENRPMLNAIKAFPGAIYAECGGFMLLCERFYDRDGVVHRLAGRVPAEIEMTDTLQGFGYRNVRLAEDCVLGAAGDQLRGHEFHFSRLKQAPANGRWAFTGKRGGDGAEIRFGYSDGRTLASYMHVHFGQWSDAARRVVARMREFSGTRTAK